MAEAQRQVVRQHVRAGFKHLRFATPARAPLHDLTLAQECLAAQPSNHPQSRSRGSVSQHERQDDSGGEVMPPPRMGLAYLRCER